jgi:hypothetical protein
MVRCVGRSVRREGRLKSSSSDERSEAERACIVLLCSYFSISRDGKLVTWSVNEYCKPSPVPYDIDVEHADVSQP